MLERKLKEKIKELSQKYPVISITGPRQSGKTTLARTLFPDHQYFNLESLDALTAAQSDPRSFLQLGSGKKLIIDEVQKFPNLLSYIQVEVDEQKIPGQFIITGSEQFALSQSITQSLAGRVGNFVLLPFSLEELNGTEFEFNNTEYFEAMVKGFYPRIYDLNFKPSDYYSDYLFTYVERDVRQIKNIGDLTNFRRFLQLVAGRVGQVVNLTSLANDVGVSHKTIESWLSILEASYIIFRLQPYFENYGKRVIKSPKIYFYDTGLLSYLLGIDNTSELSRHFAIGHIFENLIIAEELKRIANNRSTNKLYFWRDNNGNEVDLIIDEGATMKGVEIKISKTFDASMLKGLDFWQSLNTQKNLETYLIYTGELEQTVNAHTLMNWKNIDF